MKNGSRGRKMKKRDIIGEAGREQRRRRFNQSVVNMHRGILLRL